MDKCDKCKLQWKANQKWIECEYCNSGFHIKCVNIAAQQFTYLSECNQSHWYCSMCNIKMKDLIGTLKDIEKQNRELEKTQQENNIKIDNIINGEDTKFVSTVNEIISDKVNYQEGSEFVTTIKGITAEVIEDLDFDSRERQTKAPRDDEIKVLKEEIKEMNARRKKENNLVLYGVTEDLAKDIGVFAPYRQYKMDPTHVLRHIFRSLYADDGVCGDVKSAEFIGKDPKPGCPLLVRFHTKKTRDWLLEKANYLRDDDTFGNVFINKDLTKLQMKDQYELRRELKRRREVDLEEKGFTNLIIHKGTIMDRNAEISFHRNVKTFHRNVK